MKDDYIYSADDLDAILAEFRTESENDEPAPRPEPESLRSPVSRRPEQVTFSRDDTFEERSGQFSLFESEPVRTPSGESARPSVSAGRSAAGQKPADMDSRRAEYSRRTDDSRWREMWKDVEHRSPRFPSEKSGKAAGEAESVKKSRPVSRPAPQDAPAMETVPAEKRFRPEKGSTAERKARPEKKTAAERTVPESPSPAKEARKASSPVSDKPKGIKGVFFGFASLIFAAVAVTAILWVAMNVHPASGTAVAAASKSKLNLSSTLDGYMNNAASEALSELTYIPKMYTIQESAIAGRTPNPAAYGSTTDPQEIMQVIARAANLLDGQEVIFDPSADFVPDTDIKYYLDDTILVICWKEYIETRCCTCAEVKIAHASQLRRKLANDSYSSNTQLYASDMSRQANAVVAINGDFYAFRELGITVYDRTLYRNNPATVDTCFFNTEGDMIFSRAGELMGAGEAQQFIEDNDILFSVAFGPVLIDNGELKYCASYPIGEIDSQYSRAAIGMKDKLHYFLMTINHTPDGRPRANINDFGKILMTKNLQKAYTLDGGQTSELVMNGSPVNYIDFNAERTMSDIIYFATALPEEEVAG